MRSQGRGRPGQRQGGRLDKVGAARLPFRVLGRHHAQHHPGLVQHIARQYPLQIGRRHPGDALEVAVLKVGVIKQGVAGGQLLHLASHAVQRPDPLSPLGIDRVGQLLAGDTLAGELADDPIDLRLDGTQLTPFGQIGHRLNHQHAGQHAALLPGCHRDQPAALLQLSLQQAAGGAPS